MLKYTYSSSCNHKSEVVTKSMIVWVYECMKLQKLKFILVVPLLILLSSCDEEPPIPQKKFIEVYVDLLIVQDTTATNTFNLDSLKALVLEKHSLTIEEYDSNINYLNAEPERWTEFFDSANAYVERLEKNVDDQL